MRTPSLRGLTYATLAAWALTSHGHAQTTTKYPVISKVEFLFSMVTHYVHVYDRTEFYRISGNPQGNTNYAVPHLVYEPIVTLYNPYNEPLTLSRSRIKISDPPVGFTFKKNDDFIRPEFANGEFHGLARFQIGYEADTNARKSFTLYLTERRANGQPGAAITLLPGQSKTFSPWVDTDWTWGKETAAGTNPRVFFDWSAYLNFTNRDNRTGNALGFETLPLAAPFIVPNEAGFQTDGLSHSNGGRPTSTLYDFESFYGKDKNWVAIKLDDTVSVQAKSMRAFPLATGDADFQVDLMKGTSANPTDLIKTFPMTLAGIIQNEAAPVISRTFRVRDLLQTSSDRTSGGKSPFASLTMLAKTSALRANRFYQTLGTTQPDQPVTDLYELHFKEAVDFSRPPIIASDTPLDAPPEVIGTARIGNTLYVDFAGRPSPVGNISWNVRGSSSPEAGFTDDLNSASIIMTGQSANGLYKAVIDITGKGDRYFVRLEE